MNPRQQLREGLLTQNPVLVQLLGMCSTMAITTTLYNGVGMGLSVLVILTCCNVVIAALGRFIPHQIRIAVFVVVIAGFVTAVDLLLQAFLPDLSASLGVFIPLIVVNCIIMGRAEAFSSKSTVPAAAMDGLCQGLGYTLVLVIMSVIREFFGSGTFGAGLLAGGEGIRIIAEAYPIRFLVLPFGGFITLGCLIALTQWLTARSQSKKSGEEVAS